MVFDQNLLCGHPFKILLLEMSLNIYREKCTYDSSVHTYAEGVGGTKSVSNLIISLDF